MEYDIVVGLEVHIQLNTKSKLFSTESTAFGAAANEHISAITLAHPGTLPRINAEAISKAVQLGLALGCSITQENLFSRKHYLYPDLPKGFQTTQHINPICQGGSIVVASAEGTKTFPIHHIHLEEDAGKSIHDFSDTDTAIDYNRAGTPLCELVTEPCITSSDDAALFLTELRKLIRWINVSDGNMEEGSLRCDANISIKPAGSTTLGTRVEVKNLNSIKFVKKAIDYEVQRMKDLLANNKTIEQETRSFDAGTETTFTLRSKEDAHDYRYFIEPDLSPVILSTQEIELLKSQMPPLPAQLISALKEKYQLSEYDAQQLVEDKFTYNYFEQVVAKHDNAKAAANFMLGPLRQMCNETNSDFSNIVVRPNSTAEILQLIDTHVINFSIAANKLLPACAQTPASSPTQLVASLGLAQNTNTNEIETWVQQAIDKNPDKVAEYKKGKKNLIGFFMGEVKKISKGKAEPKATNALLIEKLS